MSTVMQQTKPISFVRAKALPFEQYSRLWMSILLGASDSFGLFLAILLALGLRLLIGAPLMEPGFYLRYMPLAFVFVFAYAISGLYPAIGMSPVAEIRRLTLVTTTTFFLLVVVTVWLRTSDRFSRLFLSIFWVLAVLFVPSMRFALRQLAVRAHLWGEPIAVIGSGPHTRKIIDFLRDNPLIGLRPIVLVNGFHPGEHYPEGIAFLHASQLKENPCILSKHNINTVVLVPGETPPEFQSLIVDERQFGFQRLVMISSLGWVGGSAIVPYDLQGVLGLEVQRKLLNRSEQIFKRLLDLGLVLVGGLFVLPIIGLVAWLIRLDSPGNSFYGHKRIGRDGKEIKVWKFRTMASNADQVLASFLAENPSLQTEWEASHKLKDDPRVTRLGTLLRKTSLDELPQIWNVIKGEMSLVGPRPIVQDEVRLYDHAFRLYTQVLPGMTGLWQVSGRSDTSYDSRIRLDEYYIRHWSIWMDIYVLIRTIWVVVKRSGAY